MQWIVAGAIVIRGHGWGEVAGEGALADGADALRLVADVLEDFGEAASLGECVPDEVCNCREEGFGTWLGISGGGGVGGCIGALSRWVEDRKEGEERECMGSVYGV